MQVADPSRRGPDLAAGCDEVAGAQAIKPQGPAQHTIAGDSALGPRIPRVTPKAVIGFCSGASLVVGQFSQCR